MNTRTCPACGVLAAAPGDRYCTGCGSAADRSAWADELECLDRHRGGCRGVVQYRFALSSTGRQFPRCDRHWEDRLVEQERINNRYPTMPPADFDPSYAGERWDEDE